MTMVEGEISGFTVPEKAGELLVAELRQKYGISDDASLADIEPVATRLLSKPQTFISGAELVLNRRVDAQDFEVTQLMLAGSGEDIFGALLIQKAIETQRKEKAASKAS